MRMLERRRARSTSLRMSPDVERVSWLCMPALRAAVAASEWGERELEGDWLRGGDEACGGEMVFTSGMALAMAMVGRGEERRAMQAPR